jgi:hypothetical protein
VVAFLYHNPIKVKSFGDLDFTSGLDVNVILCMMKECNIPCLGEIYLKFKEGGFTKSSDYDKTTAIAAGILEDVMYKKKNNGAQDVQRQIAQILSKRARYIKHLSICALSFHNLHVDVLKAIPASLEIVYFDFGFEDNCTFPGYIDATVRTIEALPRLKHLTLHLFRRRWSFNQIKSA